MNSRITALTRGATRVRFVVGLIGVLAVGVACIPPPTTTPSAPTLVSISVTPIDPAITATSSVRLTATGHYSDGTTKNVTDSVGWSSSNPGIATVSNVSGSQGLAVGVSGGTVTMSAAQGATVGTTSLTVAVTLASIAVTPVNAGVPVGLTQQFTALGTYSDGSVQDLTSAVVWSSTDPIAVVISNAPGSNGLATAVATGSVTITAQLGDVAGTTGLVAEPPSLVSVEITPMDRAVPAGDTIVLTTLGTFTDGSEGPPTGFVSWTSFNPSIAMPLSTGGPITSVLAVGPGTVTIQAQVGSIIGTTTVTVTAT